MKFLKSSSNLSRPMLALALGAGLFVFAAVMHAQTARPTPLKMTVYKTSTCGCCSKWVEHMKSNGFQVTALDVEDIDQVKRSYNVPRNMDSCHTGLVNGYIVEGHVPADVVHRMLREKPAIAGIAAPGMPMGSPGMEVPGYKADPYNVMAFDKAGKTSVYEKR